jgi:type 1 fimbria pilin
MQITQDVNVKIVKILILLLLGGGSGWAFGAPDTYCVADGGTHHSVLAFRNIDLSVQQNEVGQLFDTHVNNGDEYSGYCHCTKDYNTVYFTAIANPQLPESGIRYDLNYYQVNEYLDAGITIAILGRGYLSVPFNNEPNDREYNPYPCENGIASQVVYSSGSDAVLYFYIRKPFIGQVIIPPTLLASLYAKTRQSGQNGPTPLSDVYIVGSITAPQECEVNSGQIISFDLGQIPASDFSKTPGTIIADKKKELKVAIKCTGMAEGQNVGLSLHGTQSGAYPTMLQTTNDDVGVKIYDEFNNEVDVNGGEVQTDMKRRRQSGVENGSFTFYAAPASATGARPSPGTFDAVATLTLELMN